MRFLSWSHFCGRVSFHSGNARLIRFAITISSRSRPLPPSKPRNQRGTFVSRRAGCADPSPKMSTKSFCPLSASVGCHGSLGGKMSLCNSPFRWLSSRSRGNSPVTCNSQSAGPQVTALRTDLSVTRGAGALPSFPGKTLSSSSA